MNIALQILNLIASCAVAILLWRLGDRLDPFRVHARPPPLKALSFFSRYLRKRAFKPIRHEKAVGPDVPLLKDTDRWGPQVNYYVPKAEPDAELFMARHYPPLPADATPFMLQMQAEMNEGHDPDTYEVEGHTIPGPAFREVYEVAKVAVRLPRPQSRVPAYPPMANRVGGNLTRPTHKVTIGLPVPAMTEEEGRALAEEYELFEEPRPTTNGVQE